MDGCDVFRRTRRLLDFNDNKQRQTRKIWHWLALLASLKIYEKVISCEFMCGRTNKTVDKWGVRWKFTDGRMGRERTHLYLDARHKQISFYGLFFGAVVNISSVILLRWMGVPSIQRSMLRASAFSDSCRTPCFVSKEEIYSKNLCRITQLFLLFRALTAVAVSLPSTRSSYKTSSNPRLSMDSLHFTILHWRQTI